MAKRVLVPVLPTERFYDAVVAAADVVAAEGGTITFLFTRERPPMQTYERAESETVGEVDVAIDQDNVADEDTLDAWQVQMDRALDDARALCAERGIGDERIDVLFADALPTPAENVAHEAAAGAYDLVVLARSYFATLPDDAGGDSPRDVATAVRELRDDGVQLLVT